MREKFHKGDTVSATKTFNGEYIVGEFRGYRLFDDELPESVVGTVFVDGDRTYDVDVDSIRHYESEDERIRMALIELLKEVAEDETYTGRQHIPDMLSYLEKQKEQTELSLMDGNADLYFDEWNKQKQYPTKRQCFEEGMRYAQRLQKEQKPAEWNEEDEENIKKLIGFVELCWGDYFLLHQRDEMIDWLKSLRPQQKQEWDKEDRDRVEQYLHDRDGGMLWSKATEITSDILDILCPRLSWKPSEEQMGALKECGECKRCIKELYEDLQKRYGTC